MLIFALDDEHLLLRKLCRTILEILPEAEVRDFSRASAALAAMKEERLRPDIAFLDIEMPGMTGMGLAEAILEWDPECAIIFCTSYEQYAIDAIHLHVSSYLGYLLKPITAQALKKEIDQALGRGKKGKRLSVRCFGTFEVLAHGEPLSFKRTRTKELLAFLVDRRGAGVTAKQICACLWDDGTNDTKNMNYLYQLFDDLRNTLSTAGAENVLQRKGYSYYVNTGLIDCDYYRYLESGKPEFRGEYMSQYSWAEETCGLLWNG